MSDQEVAPGAGPLPNGQWWGALDRPWPINEPFAKNFLLQIIAFSPAGAPAVAGMAFIVAVGDGFALAVSARHVLDHAHTIQNPYQKHAASTPSVFLPPKVASIDPAKLRMCWMGTEHGTMLKVMHASFAHNDLAVFLVLTQDDIEKAKFKPTALQLDLSMPSDGDQVFLITQRGLDKTKLIEQDNGLLGFEQHRHAEMYLGVVTHVAKNGYGQHKHPCFTMSIPTLGGMSGSPVCLVTKPGTAIGACGVVTADLSPNYQDGQIQGHSVVTCSWLALASLVPEKMENGAKSLTLYELIKQGHMPKPLGGFENFAVQKVGDAYHVHCPVTHADPKPDSSM